MKTCLTLIFTFFVLPLLVVCGVGLACLSAILPAESKADKVVEQLVQPLVVTVQQYQEQGQDQAQAQAQDQAQTAPDQQPAGTTIFTQSWKPDPSHPMGSGVNGCPTTPAEAAALFGGTADRWNMLDDPTKTGNEKWPGWSLAEARHSDTTPTFDYLFIPAPMRGDLWDNDVAWSVYGEGYTPFHVSEATIWCWLQPGQAAPHPVLEALVAPK